MKALLTLSALVLLVLATLCSFSLAEKSYDVCHFFPNNTQVRDPDSCSRYITCIDFVSHYGSCSGSTPFYDKDTNKCVRTLKNDMLCSISCANSTGHFIQDPKSCNGYYYCFDEELALPGKCPEHQHFNATLQACVYKLQSNCKIEQFNFCAIVKNNVNFRSNAACHKYHTCTKGKLTTKICSKKYYDPVKGVCADKSTVNCLEHPLPRDVCGTAKIPKKNVFVEDDATCRGYFYCAEKADGKPDATPYWGQCPPDTFFDEKKGACVDPMKMKCEWDRCDGRTLTFVSASTKGCRNYLRCVDGITQEELSCGNLFFDEKAGICTTNIIYEAACNS